MRVLKASYPVRGRRPVHVAEVRPGLRVLKVTRRRWQGKTFQVAEVRPGLRVLKAWEKGKSMDIWSKLQRFDPA